MSESDRGPVAPVEYLKIFFRRKWLFVIPMFAGLIFGVCAGILLPKKYISSTIILVEEGKTDNPLFNNLAVSTTVAQRMSSIRESMLGWNSLLELVKRLHLDKGVRTPREFESLMVSIRSSIMIRPRSQNVIELNYVGGNAVETQAVVKNITEIFIERNINSQNQETEEAIKFIEEQLKVYKGKIMSAEIAKLQDKLNALLTDSTEEHPTVKELRELVKHKKADLEAEHLEFTEGDRLKVESTNPLINEIKKKLDTFQTTGAASSGAAATGADTDLYKIVLMDKLDNVAARDVTVNESIYNMLLQRLETAKITKRLQSSKEGTKYTILDPPRVPLRPFQPNKFLAAMIGLFFGILAGAGLVAVTEFLDTSFLDVQEAKEYLGEPLLGAISKIRTIDSVREEKERQRWYTGLTLTSGIMAVILAVFIANLLYK